MAGIDWPGINPAQLKDGLYTYGAIALLIVTTWLMGIHIYQLINPPTITMVLAMQPGGNKPQVTIYYSCGWKWSSSTAPAGNTVAFDGWCGYTMASWSSIFPSNYYFEVYIYDPFGPPANPAPYGTVNYPEGSGYETYSVTLNYIVYNGAYAWYWGVGPVSYAPNGPTLGYFTASINGYWTPNMPYTYEGCAYAYATYGINGGSPGCSSITIAG